MIWILWFVVGVSFTAWARWTADPTSISLEDVLIVLCAGLLGPIPAVIWLLSIARDIIVIKRRGHDDP